MQSALEKFVPKSNPTHAPQCEAGPSPEEARRTDAIVLLAFGNHNGGRPKENEGTEYGKSPYLAMSTAECRDWPAAAALLPPHALPLD